MMDKRAKQVKVAVQHWPPTTKLMVKVEGRSFAELLKKIKNKVSKEDVGDIFLVRKGPNEALELRVKASKDIDVIKKAINDKVQGVMVKKTVRKVQSFTGSL